MSALAVWLLHLHGHNTATATRLGMGHQVRDPVVIPNARQCGFAHVFHHPQVVEEAAGCAAFAGA